MNLLQDLRFNFRSMLRNPGFFAVAILTLALAIGANTAIFSILNAVLFRPYPYPDPGELVVVRAINPPLDVDSGSLSYADFADFREQSEAFEDMAAIRTRQFNVGGVDHPVRVPGAEATASLFGILGGEPLLGRTFLPAEDSPGGERVVVLSQKLWERLFDADPRILGQTVKLDTVPHTVVGVIPPQAQFPDTDMAELFVPAARDPVVEPRASRQELVIARLAPGVDTDRAESELGGIAARLAEQHVESNENWGVTVQTLREFRTRRFKALSLILFGVVGLVLLIACVNVSNLLLQRATVREREIAIRSAVGAQRSRVVGQLLTESVVLALAGGALGLVIAHLGLRLLVRTIPQELPSYMNDFALDGRVLVFLLAVALLTAVLFGLAPSLRLSKPNLTGSLSESGARSSGSASRRRARNALVVAEVALSLVLLIGAGLMIKSFRTLQSVDPGFEAENALALQVNLPPSQYVTPAQRTQFVEQAVERLGALPGVTAAGATTELPLNDGAYVGLSTEGQSAEEARNNPLAAFRLVGGEFLQAAGMRVVQGRAFDRRDLGDPPRSVVVSSNLAARLWPDRQPVGQRLRIEIGEDPPWLQVVGVIGDLKALEGRGEDERYQVLVPYPFRDSTAFTDLAFVLRTAGDPMAVAAAARQEIQAIDADLPVVDVQSMEQVMDRAVWLQRMTSMLFAVFAGVALVLAMVGMYGTMSYSFAQRTREIGIRMALGARGADVLRMVVRQGAKLVAIAVVIGLAAAFGLSRLLRRMLYEVESTDPATFLGVTALVVAVALAAIYIPARRASRVQPVTALRQE